MKEFNCTGVAPRVFAFHKPATLLAWLQGPDTLRGRLHAMPPLDERGLRDCQIEAIEGLDESLAKPHPRALIHMRRTSVAAKTVSFFQPFQRPWLIPGSRAGNDDSTIVAHATV